jgi:hypothetical protein
MRPTRLDMLVAIFGPFALACAYIPLVLLGFLSERLEGRAHRSHARRGIRARRLRLSGPREPVEVLGALSHNSTH